jgi:hypothetical protein
METTVVIKPTFKPCTEARFDEMLEVLPPIAWVRKGFLVGEPYTHRTCTVSGKYLAAYTAMLRHPGALGVVLLESTIALTVPEWNALNPVTLKIER